MMEGCPLKFRLIELFNETGTFWNYEVIKLMQEEYGMNSNYGKHVLNYNLIEMSASGFIGIIDMKEDTEGLYKKGSLLSQYEVTDIGRNMYEELKRKVKLPR